MSYSLPLLPYAYDGLEPYLDKATMQIHHSKHHQAYVDKLNAALTSYPNLQEKPVETILKNLSLVPESIRTPVKNHGGGHANHSLFWTIMSPKAVGEPTGQLLSAINQTFNSIDSFKTKFTETALNHFGSGWAWLVYNPGRSRGVTPTLEIYSLPNQDSPLSQGHFPLLAVDVWEHAYYLKYQNRRADYLDAFWHLINWPEVENRYQSAII